MESKESSVTIVIRLFRPWLVPALAGVLFSLGIVLLNMLLNKRALPVFLRIDPASHMFPFKNPMDIPGMDTTVVLGTRWVFWGMAALLVILFFPGFSSEKSWNLKASNFFNFLSAGCITFYFLSLFCLWLLAAYEGYIDYLVNNLLISHGPWHFTPHLKRLVIDALMPIAAAFCLGIAAFGLKINLGSLAVIITGCLLFLFHVYTHLWLID